MPDAPDEELIARAVDGDGAAYATLVRRHYRTAFSVALACTADRSDAEDVCHDAFERAAVHLEKCRERARFVHWLCTIVRNQAHNHRTRARVRKAEPLEHTTAAADDDPARSAARRELRARLERALSAIPRAQREVVLLHDLDGWTHAEIATTLGTSEGMSRQHLFQARRRLRELLGADTSTEYFNE